MKRLIKLLAIALLLPLCSCQEKEEILYEVDNVKNLTNVITTWYALSGVNYTYDSYITVGGTQIDMGKKTTELIHACSFRKGTHTATEATGTGVDKVYYQTPGPVLQTHNNVSYKDLNFNWRYSGGVLSITYTTKDDLIKDASYDIAWISETSISGKGGGGPVAKTLFLSDKSKVER